MERFEYPSERSEGYSKLPLVQSERSMTYLKLLIGGFGG
jgi:hypothetical protein